MRRLWLLMFVVVAAFGCRSADVVKPDVDTSKYRAVVIKEFSLEGTAIQENVDVQAFAKGLPKDFSENVKNYIEAMNIMDKVVLAKDASRIPSGTDYVVIEGNFTKITAGSTAARFLVGFGAGSSTVGAKWVIRDGRTGKELSSFEKNRHTSGGHRGAQAIASDANALAKDVATLLKRTIR